jgi:DNA-binding transcriptional ArsR family regulator
LKPTQKRAVAALKADPASGLTRAQYEKLAGVSRSQAAYDLAELVEAGILERIGNGRATRYRLAREGGAQRHWTSDRIRTELEAFCATRTTWPSPADFKAAGRGDLYIAASRYGGIAHWTEMLGFTRPTRDASDTPEASFFRAKLAWAGVGALAALAAAATAGAVFFAVDRHGAAVATPAAPSRGTALTAPLTKESLRSLLAATAQRPLARHVRRQGATRAALSTKRRSNEAVSISQPVHQSTTGQPSTTSAAAGDRSFLAVTPESATSPAPLPAPPGGSAPPPLKSP